MVRLLPKKNKRQKGNLGGNQKGDHNYPHLKVERNRVHTCCQSVLRKNNWEKMEQKMAARSRWINCWSVKKYNDGRNREGNLHCFPLQLQFVRCLSMEKNCCNDGKFYNNATCIYWVFFFPPKRDSSIIQNLLEIKKKENNFRVSEIRWESSTVVVCAFFRKERETLTKHALCIYHLLVVTINSKNNF